VEEITMREEVGNISILQENDFGKREMFLDTSYIIKIMLYMRLLAISKRKPGLIYICVDVKTQNFI
jgi:hypothetical protein